MKEYGLDGVFMQRFVNEVKNLSGKSHFNHVLQSAITSATKYERAISIMYDLSGIKPGDEQVLLKDIDKLDQIYQFRKRKKAPTYLFHNKKQLVAVWGVGFNDKRAYGLNEAEIIVEKLKEKGYAVLLGVPTYWREMGTDTQKDEKFHTLIKKCDIIMPWFVGRYREDSYDRFKSLIKSDLDWCAKNNIDYAPLCFPGFSWENMKGQESSRAYIDRNGGRFRWKQFSAAIGYGAKMLYVAMFDEIDEGTAIFKCLRKSEVPLNGAGRFQGIEDDLPSDHYLWLTGQASKMLKGKIPFTDQLPERSL